MLHILYCRSDNREYGFNTQSFDVGYCQASVIILWHNGGPPWIELQKPDPLARFLTIFITWSLLRVLQGTNVYD